jgi:TatD DNase family protein
MSDPNPSATVKSGAVDTHCHLFLLDHQPADVVEASRAVGVDRLICVGIDPETSLRSAEIAGSHPGVFATAGLHPNSAAEMDGRAAADIEELLSGPHVVGVGETGMDLFRMGAPADVQERVFRMHVELGRESGIPLVVHVREAWDDVLRVLREGSAERVVLHCFSGDAAVARECAARGYFLSFAANITYPKNVHLREAAAAVPLDRLLTETDSPFLSPQKQRGTDNSPSNVIAVIGAIAEARGETFGDVFEATERNAFAAFPALR